MTTLEPNLSHIARPSHRLVYSVVVGLSAALLIVGLLFLSLHRSESSPASGTSPKLILKLVGDGCNWSSSDGVSIQPKHGWYCGASLTITNTSHRVVELNARHQEAISGNSHVYYADFFTKQLQHEQSVKIHPKSKDNLLVYFTLPRNVHPRYLVLRTLNPVFQFVVPMT